MSDGTRSPDTPLNTLSEMLTALIRNFENTSTVTLFQIENYLAERGAAALILLIALPLVTPIPLPGASVVLGLVIIVLAVSMVRRRPAKLPRFIGRKSLDTATLIKIVTASRKILLKLEKYLKPRNGFMLNGSMRVIAGISLSSSAIALALPLPPIVPFTNGIPALSIVFFALGFLEEDGLFVLVGHIIGVCGWVYIGVWWEVLWRGIQIIFEKALSLFS